MIGQYLSSTTGDPNGVNSNGWCFEDKYAEEASQVLEWLV